MKELIKTAVVLMVVGLLAAAILGVTDTITREPIAEVARQKKSRAREELLPAASYKEIVFDSVEELFAAAVENNSNTAALAARYPLNTVIKNTIYAAYDEDGSISGYFLEAVSPQGYAGDIEMVVGIKVLTNDAYGEPVIADYRVIKSAETPGLGKAAEVYLHQFFTNTAVITNITMETNGRGRYAEVTTNTNIYSGIAYQDTDTLNPVDKTSDVMTGATITSVAVKDALYKSLLVVGVLLEGEYQRLDVDERMLRSVSGSSRMEEMEIPEDLQLDIINAVYEMKSYRYSFEGYVFQGVIRHQQKKYLVLWSVDDEGILNGLEAYLMYPDEDDPFVQELEMEDGALEALQALLDNGGEASEANPWQASLLPFGKEIKTSIEKMELIENE